MGETEIGIVTHYYGHLSVAGVDLTAGELSVGDTVHIKGHTSDFITRIDSLQIEHEAVEHAARGTSVGIRVPEHAREHDKVYKVTA
jgi:putative protease